MTVGDQQGSSNKDTFQEQKDRLKKHFNSSYFTVDYWSVNETFIKSNYSIPI